MIEIANLKISILPPAVAYRDVELLCRVLDMHFSVSRSAFRQNNVDAARSFGNDTGKTDQGRSTEVRRNAVQISACCGKMVGKALNSVTVNSQKWNTTISS